MSDFSNHTVSIPDEYANAGCGPDCTCDLSLAITAYQNRNKTDIFMFEYIDRGDSFTMRHSSNNRFGMTTNDDYMQYLYPLCELWAEAITRNKKRLLYGDSCRIQSSDRKFGFALTYLGKHKEASRWLMTSYINPDYKETTPSTYHEDTLVSGIVCNKCKNTLPTMTIKQHLDGDFNLECPHSPA